MGRRRAWGVLIEYPRVLPDMLRVPVPTNVLPNTERDFIIILGYLCGHQNQWINLPIAEQGLIAGKATLLKAELS